ncbi:ROTUNDIFOLIA like 8 [Zostera marina]|uniref:ROTUNDIFOLIA like 8 n=1 Tax=Zostera marina TaxID=29655 RepID=A0A0K9NM98_ZOSMR|nr:ROTUNDIFOLIA like 8 [Zostera marina]
MEMYVDENWKLSKKTSRRVATGGGGGGGKNQSLMKPTNSKTARRSFTRKCASLVKEQRARFYIMRRCVTMLICWREYQDC